jgi:hypothetical protein
MPRRNDIAKILIIGSVVFIALVVTLSPEPAIACAIFPPAIDVTPDFDILVLDHGSPVPGIPIEVTQVGAKSDHPLLTLKSGADGRVAVKGLAAGDYSVESNAAMWVPGFIARVGNPKAQVEKSLVKFQWPSYRIARVKALRGRLWSENSQSHFEDLDLRLFLVDGRPASPSQFTGPSGRFEFKDVNPGLYVMWMHAKQPHVRKGFEDEGPIVVRVDPEDQSAPAELDLPIGSTSCGIWYAQCDQQNAISLASRRIKLRDSNSAAVFAAQYVVTDSSGNQTASGLSNREGIIHLPKELRGTYKLAINSSGFTPLEQPLEFLPYDSRARDLYVVLNLGGSCSEAKLEKNATP